MYGQEPPRKLKVRDLELLGQCPASGGTRSQMPTSQLDRWIAVSDAIGEWYRQGDGEEDIADIESRFFGFLDPVQRAIASNLFTTYRRVMPKVEGQHVDLESWFSTVWDTDQNATLGAASQFALTSAEGTELVKLKTGRSSTSDAEIAVLIEGAEETEGEISFTEVNASAGTAEALHLAEEDRQALIANLFEMARPSPGKKGTVPGLHCYVCARPARCGQYPAIDPTMSGSESRAVLMSKKWLAKLGRCERQAAWARMYGIPTDDDDEDDRGPAELGISFHKATATALAADDPDAAFESAVTATPGSEQAQLRQLWDNLKRLHGDEPHPVMFRETEYGIGATAHSPGPYVDSRERQHDGRIVAVAMAGFADGVGREADGTPAVVELRTGGGSSLPLEPELYAVGAHLLTGQSPVAVHTHRIGNPDDLECNRQLFDDARLEMATEALSEAANRIASWHPTDALSAPYTVGEWCSWCQFSNRCAEFRS